MKTVTIHNLKDSSAQEVYDFIANHLLTQGCKAERSDKALSCVYRLEQEGRVLRCAAGCLIPDEDYKAEFEKGGSWKSIVHGYFPEEGMYHIDLIAALQSLHDSSSMYDWPGALTRVAIDFNLIPFKHEPDGKAETTS